MSPQLKESLQPQGVDFGDNYRNWTKPKMISKLGTVMGLGSVSDPDPSYVLTVDNLIKILAIQMRFRYVSEYFICKSIGASFRASNKMTSSSGSTACTNFSIE